MLDHRASVLAVLVARLEFGVPMTPLPILHTLSYLTNVVGPIYRRLRPEFTFVRQHFRAAAVEVTADLDFLHWNGLIQYGTSGGDSPPSVLASTHGVQLLGGLGADVATLREVTREVVWSLAAVGAASDHELGRLLFEEPGFRRALWVAPSDSAVVLSDDSFFGMPSSLRVHGVMERAAARYFDGGQGAARRRAVLRAFVDHLVREANDRRRRAAL